MDGMDGQTGPTGPAFLNTVALFNQVKDACVAILSVYFSSASIGSGFIVNPTGDIVTNYHVIHNSQNGNLANPIIADITNVNGTGENIQVQCKLIGLDGAADIAVIRPLTSAESAEWGYDFTTQTFAKWGKSDNSPEGSTCFMVGQASGLDRRSMSVGTMRDNKFMATSNSLATEATFFQTPIRPGNSGSPLFDRNGEVIGIASYSYLENGTVQMEDMGGGTNQVIAEPVVNSILTNYVGVPIIYEKGYLGISSWAPCIGVELWAQRVVNSSFRPVNVGRPCGMIINEIDDVGTTPGQRVQNATIPLQISDVILSAQLAGSPETKIEIGVYDMQYHISRLTWPNAQGAVLTLEVIRPSTGVTFLSDVTLDFYPASLDLPLSTANVKPIENGKVSKIPSH
jgi:hypothetical protein